MAILWHTSKIGSYFATRSARHALPLHHDKPTHHQPSLRAFVLNPVRLCTILLTVAFSFATLFLILHTSGGIRIIQEPFAFVPAPEPEPESGIGIPPVEPPSPHPVRFAGSDVVYDAFLAPSAVQALADPRIRPIRAHEAMPYACLDRWVATGLWAAPCLHGMVYESRIDLVYVWVNGSDALHSASRTALLANYEYETKDARFREHDELRYSLRAARNATRWWPDSTWHVVTADVKEPDWAERISIEEEENANAIHRRAAVPLPTEELIDTRLTTRELIDTRLTTRERRLGLVPQWLDIECAFNVTRAREAVSVSGNETEGRRQPPIVLHHDTQLFRYSDDPGVRLQAEDAAQWLAKVVPSFNSHAIESQLANLPPDIVSDQIVAMNDDQFLTLPTPPSAFHTTLYGPVFRMDPDLLVGGDNTGAGDGGGEWRSIPWSGHLLDERFGTRKRPYMKHISRSLSLPLLHECLLAFGKPYAATPLSQFRGAHFADREWEVNTIFLATHFIIERHREALLWSWVVGKWGGGLARVRGVLDSGTKRAMWQELWGKEMSGDAADEGANIVKRKPAVRTTMGDVEANLKRAGVRPPAVKDITQAMDTRYSWVSMNGYSPTWKRLMDKVNIDPSCIGNASEPAWKTFRRLVMVDLKCGDQIIASLLYNSPSGLGIFLPVPVRSSSRPTPSPPPSTPEPITLPLRLPPTEPFFPSNPRAFAVRLIQRYAYAIGYSPMYFIGPKTPAQAKTQLRTADIKKSTGLLCINDDLGDDPRQLEEADRVFRSWFEKRWPERLECELDE
ncbi:hypothetical protein C8F01DRAFT_1366746 [Mycena amicta]|nr:hypothetical protein C8F01DRAFT_1366746 [Mycena amicta]